MRETKEFQKKKFLKTVLSQLTLNNSHNSHKLLELLIASYESLNNDEGYYFDYVSLTLVCYTCSSKPAIHVYDCFKTISHVGKM